MFISKVRIRNLRCFEDTEIEFNKGLNVIIGENNSGKTTIFKALRLVFDRTHTGHFTIDDFYKSIKLKDGKPPEISVTITLESSENDSQEDKAIVASWLTKLEPTWQATLTYVYFLPEKDSKDYADEIAVLASKENNIKNNDYWAILEEFLPKYVSRIYGGDFNSKNRAEPEYLNKFDCETLDAIRDVESKMFTGQNVILKDALNHFLDLDLKKSNKNDKDKDIKERKNKFKANAKILLNDMIKRIDKQNIIDLAKETGAGFGGKPGIDGVLKEKDLISVLKLIILKSDGKEIPIINNGLGYNNLIYISLILSKLQMIASDDRFGENAKIFPFLLIEEPEAHLHPPMQYKFLKFLADEIKKGKRSRQIFITSHSTHITSAVNLDSIICTENVENDKIEAKYPGRVFSDSYDDKNSKKYIERFLDATKSNMLFSKGIIFVEGLAEQLLMPCLAEYIFCPIEEEHVSVVRVDGLTFKHFIKIFGAGIKEDRKKFALSRRVSCIVDVDPKRREKNVKNARFKACWPFEINADNKRYEYLEISRTISNLEEVSEKTTNVEIYSNKTGKGKTFEYDLAWENAGPDFWHLKKNSSSENEELNEIYKRIEGSSFSDDDKKKAKRAVSFLLFAANKKGESAFDLESKLRENLFIKKENYFKVPPYIKKAIYWACDKPWDEKDGNGQGE